MSKAHGVTVKKAVAPKALPPINCGIDTPTLTVGQKINLSCELPAGVAGEQKFFNSDTKAKQFTIEFLGQPKSVTGGSTTVLTQTLTSYRVGKHDLDQIHLKLGDKEFLVSKQSFEVTSVMPQPSMPPQAQGQPPGQPGVQEPTPFPIADPIHVPAPWWWWAMWAGLLLVIAFFVWREVRNYLKRRAELRKSEVEAIPLTPQEKFLKAMRELESHGYHMKGNYKQFALGLTAIMKRAIGSRFVFEAEDMTSEELLMILQKKQPVFFKEMGEILKDWLAQLDQIKFAKIETTPEKCVSLLDLAGHMGHRLFGVGL